MPAPVSVRWAGEHDVVPAFVTDGIPEPVVHDRLAKSRIAIAEVAGETVGGLHLEYLWGTRPYIALIRVAPPYQRSGVGRTMLAFVEDALRAKGVIELLSSSQANETEPQEWHRHMGFIDCGVLRAINEGGIDEVFFRKAL